MRCGSEGTPGLRHFQELAVELQKVPSFVKERIIPERLFERYNAGMAAIEFDPNDGGLIRACCFLWGTRLEDVVELGTLWVRNGHRKNDDGGNNKEPLSEKMMADCTRIAREHGWKAVLFTRLDCIAELARQCDWLEDACGACHMLRTLIRPNPPDPASAQQDPPTRFFCSW